MTNYDELVKNPPEIWLQSYDDTTALDQDRLWCEDKVWPDHEDDHEPVKYVRADLAATLEDRAALADQVGGAVALPSDVTELVIAARQFWEMHNDLSSERARAR